jgi:DNA-directed RNA polymerase specialized sigma24 family protein
MDMSSRPPLTPGGGPAGDTDADSDATAGVTALYQGRAVGLIRLAIVMLGDRGAAEDVVQDAFLGLYRHWERLADPGNALTYVRSAVLNRCRNALRQRGQSERQDRRGPGPMASESAEAVALIGEESAAGESSQFTASRVLRWSSDGRQLAFAWNSTAIRVLDASAPDGNLITSSSLLAAIGTTHSSIGSFTCAASEGWQLTEGGEGVICAGGAQADLSQPSGAKGGVCTPSERTFVGFLQGTSEGQGDVPMNLADVETECSAQAGYPDGAYLGWANADASVVIGSLVWDVHVRFGLFRDGRFTPLPALPVSVPVPNGVLIGTYDW